MPQIIVQKISEEEARALGTGTWSPWECKPMEFDWEYDSIEKAHILQGKAKVTTPEGEEAVFGAGDLVTFPKGLKCRWQVIEKIRKLYTFE